MTYLEKLRKRIDESGSNLCVGLDPRPDYIDGDVGDFLLRVIDETQTYAAAYKPNMAYFEAMGLEGMLMLQNVLDQISPEIPVIQDGKRGDIGETQRYYAKAAFEAYEFDAVTLNPYLGADTIQPFLEYSDKGIYLLGVTSNQGAKDIQLQQTRIDGRHIFEIVQAMTGLAAQIGLVVGLTNADEVIIEKILDVPLLIPGLGAQGGSLSSLRLQHRKAPILVNVSRGILFSEPHLSFEDKAHRYAEQIAQVM